MPNHLSTTGRGVSFHCCLFVCLFPEFGAESECLLQETQPELQQYFLQYGYDVFFVDLNLNYDYDPFVDPYAFQCMLSEIEEASKCSDAIFFLVSARLGSLSQAHSRNLLGV